MVDKFHYGYLPLYLQQHNDTWCDWTLKSTFISTDLLSFSLLMIFTATTFPVEQWTPCFTNPRLKARLGSGLMYFRLTCLPFAQRLL